MVYDQPSVKSYSMVVELGIPSERRPTTPPNGRPRHLVQLPRNEYPLAGSVWWPPPPVALEQVSTATQPGSSRATGGGGHHTEPLMCLGRAHWTLTSGMLHSAHSDNAPPNH